MIQIQIKIILIVLLLAMAGCQSFQPGSQSLYLTLGGYTGVTRIAELLIDKSHQDPMLNELFVDTDAAETKHNLADFLCRLTGGGCEYNGAEMQDIHAGLEISKAEFDHFVSLLISSMDTLEVPFQAQNQLLNLLSGMRSEVIEL